MDDKLFKALGTNDYASLIGNPNGFAFTQSGGIFNAGNLAVESGQSLTLVGGSVINTGTLSAHNGNITISAVPGERFVRISESGSLLSYDLPVETKAAINQEPFTPLSLPQLLTVGSFSKVTNVTVENGGVKVAGSSLPISNFEGTVVVSNQVDVSGVKSGSVNIQGDNVSLINANINASGTNGGGRVFISSGDLGQVKNPNRLQTFVSQDSTINADALENGNGGRVSVSSDEATQFYGKISAGGGSLGGDGGYIEVLGKQNLTFNGSTNVEAPAGKVGEVVPTPIIEQSPDGPPPNPANPGIAAPGSLPDQPLPPVTTPPVTSPPITLPDQPLPPVSVTPEIQSPNSPSEIQSPSSPPTSLPIPEIPTALPSFVDRSLPIPVIPASFIDKPLSPQLDNPGVYPSFPDRPLSPVTEVFTRQPSDSGVSSSNVNLYQFEQVTAQQQPNTQTNNSCNVPNNVATATLPNNSLGSDRSKTTVSNFVTAERDRCGSLEDDKQILQILGETPDVDQSIRIMLPTP